MFLLTLVYLLVKQNSKSFWEKSEIVYSTSGKMFVVIHVTIWIQEFLVKDPLPLWDTTTFWRVIPLNVQPWQLISSLHFVQFF